MKKWIGFTALLALSACSSSPPRGTASETSSAVIGDYTGPIIDAHMHFEGEETGPSEAMLAEMKKNNIRGAVVHASQKKGVPDIQTTTSPKFAICAAAVPGKRIADVQKGTPLCIWTSEYRSV